MMSGAKWGLLAALLAAAVLFTLAIMWVFGVALFSASTAETRGQTGVREDTVADSDFRIAAYERFYDMCAAVQSAESRITNAETELADDPTESRESQLKTTLQALRNQRSEAINEYNAEARMEATAAQFRASDLPASLDPDEETTCTAE